MTQEGYDAIVVGCGPGGAVAGRILALNGAKTLILESKRDIGVPVRDAGHIIYSLSVAEDAAQMKIDPSCIYSNVDQILYFTSKAEPGEPFPMEDGCVVNRRLFDKFLAIQAGLAGAQIAIDHRVVDVIKEGGAVRGVLAKNGSRVIPFRARVVIAADGICSTTARMAGLKIERSCYVGMGHDWINVKTERPYSFEIYRHPYFQGGYGYLLAHGENEMNVGMWGTPEKIANSLRGATKWFVDYLQETGRYDFRKASPVSLMAGSTIRLWDASGQRILADGIMAVGDAGRRPEVGSKWGTSGIHHAMLLGRFAAETAIEALKKGDVSERQLLAYVEKIENSLQGEGEFVKESREIYRKLGALPPEQHDRAVKELGKEYGRFHFLVRGGLPFKDTLETARDWLGEKK